MIRIATAGDITELRGIAHDAYLSYVPRIGRKPAPMVADFTQLVDQGNVWVLTDPDIVGYIVMYPSDGALHVENVAVAPLMHGMGYGAQLLAFAEYHARDQHLCKIDLYTNVKMTENLSFYPALGYREIARGIEDGFSRVYFSKPLS